MAEWHHLFVLVWITTLFGPSFVEPGFVTGVTNLYTAQPAHGGIAAQTSYYEIRPQHLIPPNFFAGQFHSIAGGTVQQPQQAPQQNSAKSSNNNRPVTIPSSNPLQFQPVPLGSIQLGSSLVPLSQPVNLVRYVLVRGGTVTGASAVPAPAVQPTTATSSSSSSPSGGYGDSKAVEDTPRDGLNEDESPVNENQAEAPPKKSSSSSSGKSSNVAEGRRQKSNTVASTKSSKKPTTTTSAPAPAPTTVVTVTDDQADTNEESVEDSSSAADVDAEDDDGGDNESDNETDSEEETTIPSTTTTTTSTTTTTTTPKPARARSQGRRKSSGTTKSRKSKARKENINGSQQDAVIETEKVEDAPSAQDSTSQVSQDVDAGVVAAVQENGAVSGGYQGQASLLSSDSNTINNNNNQGGYTPVQPSPSSASQIVTSPFSAVGGYQQPQQSQQQGQAATPLLGGNQQFTGTNHHNGVQSVTNGNVRNSNPEFRLIPSLGYDLGSGSSVQSLPGQPQQQANINNNGQPQQQYGVPAPVQLTNNGVPGQQQQQQQYGPPPQVQYGVPPPPPQVNTFQVNGQQVFPNNNNNNNGLYGPPSQTIPFVPGTPLGLINNNNNGNNNAQQQNQGYSQQQQQQQPQFSLVQVNSQDESNQKRLRDALTLVYEFASSQVANRVNNANNNQNNGQTEFSVSPSQVFVPSPETAAQIFQNTQNLQKPQPQQQQQQANFFRQQQQPYGFSSSSPQPEVIPAASDLTRASVSVAYPEKNGNNVRSQQALFQTIGNILSRANY